MIVISYSAKNTVTEVVKTYGRFFSLKKPRKFDSDGLLECLGRALIPLGVTNVT